MKKDWHYYTGPGGEENRHGFFDYNLRRNAKDVLQPAGCELVVGDQYMMRVDGANMIRVLLISSAVVTEHNELRVHVVVLEDNLYVKSGAECKPLACMLHKP